MWQSSERDERRAGAPIEWTGADGLQHGAEGMTGVPEIEAGKALLFAQQVADETVEEARRQAAQILDEARAEAERLRASTPRPAAGGPAPGSQLAELEAQLRDELELVARTVDVARRRLDAGFELLRSRLDAAAPDRSHPSGPARAGGTAEIDVRDPARAFGDVPAFD